MRNTFRVLCGVLIMTLFIMRPVSSYADWHGHEGDHHDRGHHDRDHHDRSYIGVNFSVWPDYYYYSAPYYPPTDAVLYAPPVYQPVEIINGTRYYLHDGTYYVYNGYSYQPAALPATVVQEPVEVVQPPPVVTASTPGVGEVDSFTINIPNDKGDYTAVTVKKSGNGFIGPQGEFYPEFPKVSQLKVIYGK